MSPPRFPEFKKIELSDRDQIHEILWNYQPEISELTFTNLFMWRRHYRFRWSLFEHWLLIIGENDQRVFTLEPVGPPGREAVLQQTFSWISSHNHTLTPYADRCDRRILGELQSRKNLTIEALRDSFDYLYKTRDLIELTGRPYHSKRNHINRFQNTYSWHYEPLTSAIINECLDFSDRWCRTFHCSQSLGLCAEWKAIRESLLHFEDLKFTGAAIRIGGHIVAFTYGELLNNSTAVIHIEKADPEIHGLYAAIHQQFLYNRFTETCFVNREQDLGDPGLRKAKESYHPVSLIEKFRISPIF